MTQIKILIMAAIAAASFAGAWIVQDWRYEAKEAERLEAQREHERANAMTADAASQSHEEAKAEIRTEFKTIYQEVEKIVQVPHYRDNICLTADGLRVVNRASNSTATSQPTAALRAPEPAQ